MATVSSVNSLKVAVALAERQVQRDQSQVQQDANRLDQSQAQLSRDQRTLSAVQDQSRSAQSAASKAAKPAAAAPRLDRAIQTQAGKAEPLTTAAAAITPKAQLNTQGETIGKLINVLA